MKRQNGNNKTNGAHRLTLFNVFSYARYFNVSFLVLSGIAVTLDIGLRQYMGFIIDAIEAGNSNVINWYLLFGAASFFVILKFLLPWLKTRATNTLQEKMRYELEFKALNAEQTCIDSIDPGKASTYYVSDITGIVRYVERFLGKAVPDALTFILSTVTLALMNPWLSVAAVLSSIIPVLTIYWMSHVIEKGYARYQSILERINQTVSNRLYNLEFAKANSLEKTFENENNERLAELYNEKKSLSFRESILSVPTMISAFITILVIALIGRRFVKLSIISLGDLFSAIVLIDYIVNPVMGFRNTVTQIRRAKINVSRINEFISITNERWNGNFISGVAKQETSIEIKNLNFSYSDEKYVLRNLNVNWQSGKLNIVIGQNGIGKSTIFKLLSGVYHPQSGKITVSGSGINKLSSFDELRNHIVIDPQKTAMISDSIRNNLTLGYDVSSSKIASVCSLVGIYDDIQDLPNGFDTQLGSDGTPLSGGQKRRLCIARALLKEAPIYLFDEPTVGIDPEHIELVINALKELSQRCLVIVVTHEPLLIQAADSVTNV